MSVQEKLNKELRRIVSMRDTAEKLGDFHSHQCACNQLAGFDNARRIFEKPDEVI